MMNKLCVERGAPGRGLGRGLSRCRDWLNKRKPRPPPLYPRRAKRRDSLLLGVIANVLVLIPGEANMGIMMTIISSISSTEMIEMIIMM